MLKELKYKVLVVSSSEKFIYTIKKLFSPDVIDMIDFVSNTFLARRMILERSYEIVIVNNPIASGDGIDFSIDIIESYNVGVILFTSSESYHEVFDKTHELGILTISKPASTDTFIQVFRLLCSTRERIHNLDEKRVSFNERLEIIRLVDEAKIKLIKYAHFSEDEAHKYIERQAMQFRITKKQSALMIIDKYKD